MSNAHTFDRRDGMVLIDNYWIDEVGVEKYLVDRTEAAEKALTAMRTFCTRAERQWAGSEDGEAVVGFNADQSICSVVHLNPKGVKLILSLSLDQLVDYLKEQ